MPTIPRIQRGSKEFIFHGVVVNAVPVNTGYDYADIPLGATVTTWTAVTATLDGKAGHLIGPGTAHDHLPGVRVVMVRVTDTPEVPVIRVGEYRID